MERRYHEGHTLHVVPCLPCEEERVAGANGPPWYRDPDFWRRGGPADGERPIGPPPVQMAVRALFNRINEGESRSRRGRSGGSDRRSNSSSSQQQPPPTQSRSSDMWDFVSEPEDPVPGSLGQHEEQPSEEPLPEPELDSPEFESFQSMEIMTVVGEQRPPDVHEAAGAHGGVRGEGIATHGQYNRRGGELFLRSLLGVAASVARSGKEVFELAARLSMRMASTSMSFTLKAGSAFLGGSDNGGSGASTLGRPARGGPQRAQQPIVLMWPALGVQGLPCSVSENVIIMECIGALKILSHHGSGLGDLLKRSWRSARQPVQNFISASMKRLGSSQLWFVAPSQGLNLLRGCAPFAISLATFLFVGLLLLAAQSSGFGGLPLQEPIHQPFVGATQVSWPAQLIMNAQDGDSGDKERKRKQEDLGPVTPSTFKERVGTLKKKPAAAQSRGGGGKRIAEDSHETSSPKKGSRNAASSGGSSPWQKQDNSQLSDVWVPRSVHAKQAPAGTPPSRSGAALGFAKKSSGLLGIKKKSKGTKNQCAAQRARWHKDMSPGHLRRLTVGPDTQVRYEASLAEFMATAQRLGWRLQSAEDWDRSLDVFLHSMYQQGEQSWLARDTLYGVAWKYDFNLKNPKILQLSRKSLRGWLRRHPQGTRDPPIKEAVALISEDARLREGKLGSYVHKANWVAADLYLRPTEMADLETDQVTPPSDPQYNDWVVTIAPQTGDQPGKNREFDQSVVVGFAWRKPFVVNMLKELYDEAMHRGGGRLFPENFLCAWEACNRRSANRMQLRGFSVSPHGMRHAGPSWDVYEKLADLPAVQSRGRWLALQSTRRYSKSASLLRQVKKLSVEQRTEARRIISKL